MHIEINIIDYPDDWTCGCGNKIKYNVKFKGVPDGYEPPIVRCYCCDECLKQSIEELKPLTDLFKDFLKKYEIAVSKVNMIATEKIAVSKVNMIATEKRLERIENETVL